MIAWLYPAALVSLAAIAGPILVHLLRRQHAVRVLFPSVRFIPASRAAAIRLRPPSDIAILALRLLIVALAALAWARPIAISPSRLDRWSARLVRAVAIDASASMRSAIGNGETPLAEARSRADAESQGATVAARIEDADLRLAIRRAVAAVAATPPARREIIVLSDFQEGTLSAEDLRDVPASVGLRMIRVGADSRERRFSGEALFGADRLAVPEIVVAGSTTAARVVQGSSAASGLRIVAPDGADVRTLLQIVADAGAPAPAAAQPLTIVFGAASAPRTGEATRAAAWTFDTVRRLGGDAELAAIAAGSDAIAALGDGAPWVTVSRARDGKPLLRAAASGDGLVLQAAVETSSLFAAAVVRGALAARAGVPTYREQEILSIPAATLTAWSRPPAAVTAETVRQGGESDARWWWAAVLLALAVETIVVHRRRHASEEAAADAA